MRVLSLFAVLSAAAASVSAESYFAVRDIFPAQPLHVHGSSVVACGNGDLLAVWFQGSGERSADNVVLNGARLAAGGDSWSSVFPMADTPGFPDCNPVLFIDKTEKLWLFWIRVLAHRWECSQLKYLTATDYQTGGPPHWSWQGDIQLAPGEAFVAALEEGFKKAGIVEGMWGEYSPPYPEQMVEAAKDPYKRQTGWMTRIHPLQLESGRILLPIYSDGFNVSMTAISDDGGETWRASLPIVGAGPIQPSLIRKNDGTIAAYLRDSGDAPPRVMLAKSEDNGETWSNAHDTAIPNPGSSLEVIRLADGRWVMVCNDTAIGRRRLSAWMSDDEGETWNWKAKMEPCGDDGESFAYPSVIQTPDGRIHCTYSHTVKNKGGAMIRHAVFTADWIVENAK